MKNNGKPSSGEKRGELVRLQNNSYGILQLFIVVRRVIDKLELDSDLPDETVDKIILNRILDTFGSEGEKRGAK